MSKNTSENDAKIIPFPSRHEDIDTDTTDTNAEVIDLSDVAEELLRSAVDREIRKVLGQIAAKNDGDNSQYRKSAEKVAALLNNIESNTVEDCDNGPSIRTRKLGSFVLALALADPQAAKILNTTSVRAELERIAEYTHPTLREDRTMAILALKYFELDETKSDEKNNTDPEPASID